MPEYLIFCCKKANKFIRKLTFVLLVAMLPFYGNGQIIYTVTKCAENHKQGHLKYFVELFKNECLDKTKHYRFADVTLSEKETVQFLNHGFQTDIFNQFCFLEKCSFNITVFGSDEQFSFGMVGVGFSSKEKLKKAMSIIRSRHNEALYLKVLTRFVLLKENDTIVVVFTESTDAVSMRRFFDKLKTMKEVYVPVT